MPGVLYPGCEIQFIQQQATFRPLSASRLSIKVSKLFAGNKILFSDLSVVSGASMKVVSLG